MKDEKQEAKNILIEYKSQPKKKVSKTSLAKREKEMNKIKKILIVQTMRKIVTMRLLPQRYKKAKVSRSDC